MLCELCLNHKEGENLGHSKRHSIFIKTLSTFCLCVRSFVAKTTDWEVRTTQLSGFCGRKIIKRKKCFEKSLNKTQIKVRLLQY